MKKSVSQDSKKEKGVNSKKERLITLNKLPLRNFIYASLLINIISFAGIFLINKYLPPEIPLFYGLPEGREQLTGRYGLLIAAGTSFLIVIINLSIASLLKNEYLRKALVVVGFCVSTLAFITIAEIIILVGVF